MITNGSRTNFRNYHVMYSYDIISFLCSVKFDLCFFLDKTNEQITYYLFNSIEIFLKITLVTKSEFL